MGMEFELKYAAQADSFARLKADFAQNAQVLRMETTYYDTPSGDLSKLHYTLRRRMENDRSVCTIKTPAGDARGEWEIESEDIRLAIPELCKLGAPAKLLTLTAQGVVPVCGAKFTRHACSLPTPDGMAELALDEGVLLGGGNTLPILEVELELKSGSKEALVQVAKLLSLEYHLMPEEQSKFRRAKNLAGGAPHG